MKRVGSRVPGLVLSGPATLLSLVLLVGCSQGLSIGGPSVQSGAPASAPSSGKPGAVSVDVAYLNHPPVRPVLTQVDQVLAKYGDRVTVNRYDFDTPQGASFAKAHNLTEHTPVAIFINGSMETRLNGRQVKFSSFPQGQGTGMVADGAWTVQDLDAALAQATGGKP